MSVDNLTRSVLFETVDSSGEIQESFTLVIPPMSWVIREPQRVNITKTFGGVFVDDYGEDNLEIIIAGHSGTARAFPTWRQTNSSVARPSISTVRQVNAGQGELYDGRNAFFTFRNAIMRYKTRPGYEEQYIRVYDLYDAQQYECVLLEFMLQRTNQNPFRYPYMIKFFVRQKLDEGGAPERPVFPQGNTNNSQAVTSPSSPLDTTETIDDSPILFTNIPIDAPNVETIVPLTDSEAEVYRSAIRTLQNMERNHTATAGNSLSQAVLLDIARLKGRLLSSLGYERGFVGGVPMIPITPEEYDRALNDLALVSDRHGIAGDLEYLDDLRNNFNTSVLVNRGNQTQPGSIGYDQGISFEGGE